jgi:hypothetical protein
LFLIFQINKCAEVSVTGKKLHFLFSSPYKREKTNYISFTIHLNVENPEDFYGFFF